MSEFKHISVTDAAEKLPSFKVVDIRDPHSFAAGHMPDAMHLSNDNFSEFLSSTPKDSPVLVVCYHGVSSQQAANMILQQGFNQVYSMDGGFETWKLTQPVVMSDA